MFSVFKKQKVKKCWCSWWNWHETPRMSVKRFVSSCIQHDTHFMLGLWKKLERWGRPACILLCQLRPEAFRFLSVHKRPLQRCPHRIPLRFGCIVLKDCVMMVPWFQSSTPYSTDCNFCSQLFSYRASVKRWGRGNASLCRCKEIINYTTEPQDLHKRSLLRLCASCTSRSLSRSHADICQIYGK